MPRILAFAGSARKDSFNKKFLRIAVERVEAAGGEVTVVDLRDYPMPLYDGDLEAAEGHPENSNTLYAMMKEHKGLLLACPEYNSGITPLLKNTIDWISRQRPGDGPLAAYTGKVAGLISASPGALGGLRGLVQVRSILGNIGVIVLPTQVALSKAGDAFDEQGNLKDEAPLKNLDKLANELVQTVSKLS